MMATETEHKMIAPHEDLSALHDRAAVTRTDLAVQTFRGLGAFGLSYGLRGLRRLGCGDEEGQAQSHAAALAQLLEAPYEGQLHHKQDFSDTVRALGYRAPVSLVARPDHSEAALRESIAGLDLDDPARFCKPVFASQGEGTYLASDSDDALAFVRRSDRLYLVQSHEEPVADLRVILHRDVTDLRNGNLPTWRIAYEKVRPEVVGNGTDSLGRLVEQASHIPLKARKKVEKYADRGGIDLGVVPEPDEKVVLIDSGNVSKGAYSVLLTENEQVVLDRFMLTFLQDVERRYDGWPLPTFCVDIGLERPQTLEEPYDEQRLKQEIIFYERQVVFGTTGYLDHLEPPDVQVALRHLPETTRANIYRARIQALAGRSILASGIEAARMAPRAA